MNDYVSLHLGDCLDVLREMPAESVDAVVTDPPYALTSGSLRVGFEHCLSWIALKIQFPDFNHANAQRLEEFQLSVVSSEASSLHGVKGGGVETGVSVPPSTVDLKGDRLIGEPEVHHDGITGEGVTEGMLTVESNPQSRQLDGSYHLQLRGTEEALAFCKGACSCYRQLGPGCISVAVVVGNTAFGDRLGGSDSPGFVGSLADDVRLGDDSFGGPSRTASVVAGRRAEVPAVLTLDLGRRAAVLRPADAAYEPHFALSLSAAQFVRARTGAGGFSSPFKSDDPSGIDSPADRALTVDRRLATHLRSIIPSRGFMGKDWDNESVAFSGDYWKDVLRVLKPGAHGIVAGGTRTHHRLGIALEDAGFEIRDSILWIHGQGFPKSLDVSKAIDKMGGTAYGWFGPWLRQERERRGITQKELAQHFPSKTGGLTGCVANWELSLNLPTPEQFNRLCAVLELPFDRVEQVEREVIGKRTTGIGTGGGTTPVIGDTGNYDLTAPATEAAKQWQGWGTALKPATEVWWLVRKPLDSPNVASNVLKHGCGALNIDATRVGNTVETWPTSRNYMSGNMREPGSGASGQTEGTGPAPAGRWPSNLTLTHSELCRPVGVRKVRSEDRSRPPRTPNAIYGNGNGTNLTASGTPPDPDGTETVPAWDCATDGSCPVYELDRQSGESVSVPHPGSDSRKRQLGFHMTAGANPYADSGGASRFFPTFRYEPKASTAERNQGLSQGYLNRHPTVKSVELMRWLCRLVTPPGGTILDCFAGSGSTGVAARLEGFRFIGIEKDAESYETARRRLEWAVHEPGLFDDEEVTR